MKEHYGDEFVFSEMFELMTKERHDVLEDSLRTALLSGNRHTVNLLAIYNTADPTNPDEMAYAGALMGWYLIKVVG